jgi:phosphoglycolate phosphatase-like HAD superfamily hydrolase
MLQTFVNRHLLRSFTTNTINKYPQTVRWQNIRGVIGDLGDTVISGDPMVRAMQGAFMDVFQLSVPSHEIFVGFGMPKHQQIRDILSKTQRHKLNFPFEQDIDVVHSRFEQRLCDYYVKYGVQYLPGTEGGLHLFNQRNIRFGATTGLSNRVIEHVERGLPGSTLTISQIWPILSCERPSPMGIHKILEHWNRSIPPSQRIKLQECIKVGDSMSDLLEARAAGIPFIGISKHRARSSRLEQIDIEYEFKLQGAICTVATIDELCSLFI